jgi:YidC/Oxa1 family membrane protein insertase
LSESSSEQLRLVAFIVLAVVIFLAWSYFFKPPEPPPKPGQGAAKTAPAQSLPSGLGPSGKPQPSAIAGPVKPTMISAVQASAERTIVVESTLYRVELSNRGGVVRSWKLKNYLDDQKPPYPLELVNQDASQQLGWPFSLLLPDTQLQEQANSALYQISSSAGTLIAPAELTFHWSDAHLDVAKTLKFGQGYELSVEASASLDGKPLATAVAWRGGFGDRAVYKAAQSINVFYRQGGKLSLLQYKKLGVSGNQSQPLEIFGPMDFLGIEDQFFTTTFLPDGADLSFWHWTQYHTPSGGGESEPEAEIAAGTTTAAAPLRARVYVGPKDLALLSRERPSLEELVNFGWTGIIAKPMLFALQWMHRYISNWGWVIVVFTLALTMVLLPIRLWTFRSTRKMQAVAPEIKAIQDRYKKYSLRDPRKRKMNEEVMAVYSREGINPLGSCLPMLVQIPFLWAFYRMLVGAIELRHAHWIWWIHDLSAKDPYYILPIAMAVTTYLMTKMTPTPATVDPAQQRMMALMPLMLAFIFLTLSSGLNLYYFTSNVVGVAQQWYLNRAHPLPARSKFKKKP